MLHFLEHFVLLIVFLCYTKVIGGIIMNKKYEPLFSPWKIGNVEIKNRIVVCPMGGTSLFGWMEKHHFDRDAAKFFKQIAENNAGLIIPGIAPLKNIMGGQWLYKSKKPFIELKKYMDEIHKTGAKLFVQLTAGFGRSFSIPNSLVHFAKSRFLSFLLKPIIDLSYLTASPSELPSRWEKNVKCRKITEKEIKKIIFAFGRTAKMCQEAGVDGVEVHAVHEGYLLDQFTLKYTNKRNDKYGGSFENRFRFAVDVVKEIKKVCGQSFPVSLRYSAVSKTKAFGEGAIPGEKYVEIGRDLKESEKAVKYLEEAGYDMLNTDNGTYDAWYWAHPPAYMPKNCNLNEVAHIKKFTNLPVVCAGRMEPVDAANAIKNGQIDAMGVARQFLADPEWITKLLSDNIEDILPCICCHNGCFPLAHYKGVACDTSMEDSKHMSRCALNPLTMQNGKFDIKPAKKIKDIAVIGGGIAGMEVARVASLRGHNVTIYEKTNELGGVFIAAAKPSFKEKDRMLINWYRTQIKKLGIAVKLNTEILSLKDIKADEIVIATGAVAKQLKFPGVGKAIEAVDYLLGKPVGEKVAVVGGGLTGCEIAYDLFLKGKKPFIIETKDDLMVSRGLCMANSSFLKDFFKSKKVPIFLESKVEQVLDKSVIICDKSNSKIEVEADSVITAIGYTPNPLFKEQKKIHVVGDAKEVGNLRTVVWGAWEIAEKL